MVPTHFPRPRAGRLALAALVALAGLAPARADVLASFLAAGETVTAATTATELAPMIAVVDAATGQLRAATAREAAALLARPGLSLRRGLATQTRVTAWADGTLSAVLGPEYLEYAVATVEADDALRFSCATGADATQPAASGSLLEEK